MALTCLSPQNLYLLSPKNLPIARGEPLEPLPPIRNQPQNLKLIELNVVFHDLVGFKTPDHPGKRPIPPKFRGPLGACGGIGHLAFLEEPLFSKSLCDLPCRDSEEGLVLAPSASSDQQVDMIVLDGDLLDLHEEAFRVLSNDLMNEIESRRRPETPMSKDMGVHLQHKMQGFFAGERSEFSATASLPEFPAMRELEGAQRFEERSLFLHVTDTPDAGICRARSGLSGGAQQAGPCVRIITTGAEGGLVEHMRAKSAGSHLSCESWW